MDVFDEIIESLSDTLDMMEAVYQTLVSIVDFISAITGWLGFTTMVVLFGVLFCYKIFQALFPADRAVNFALALAAFTAIWITWSINYEGSPRVQKIIEVYGFISLHFLAFFILHKILRRIALFLQARLQKPGPAPGDTLELFELVDAASLDIKSHLKAGRLGDALESLDRLSRDISKSEKQT